METLKDKINHLSKLVYADESVDAADLRQIKHLINNLKPSEIAEQIASMPPKARLVVWELVDSELEGEVIGLLSEELQSEILSEMESHEVAELTEGLAADDVADILQQLPEDEISDVLNAMTAQERQRVEQVLTYDEDTAGGLMNTDTISVRPELTIDVVLRFLRRYDKLPRVLDSLYVVSRDDTFLGELPVSRLLTASPNITVRELMATDITTLTPDMPDSEVARLFERRDWVSAPVIDADKKLLGRITIDDVVDVIIEDAEHSMNAMAKLSDDEETFASVKRTAPRRAIWLGVNLLTALLASSVINLFQGTIEKVVALAILMPIVASMGGVAGSQTLTVVIRGMALGQVSNNNIHWLLSKEAGVGAINGMVWAIIMGVIAALWFQDPIIAYIIAAAMAINLIAAAIAGTTLPMILKFFHIDPALAGSVVLTTVTDVVGFVSFLGLATLFYA